MPPETVKVDRSTIFGNPFPAEVYGQVEAVDRFRHWLAGTMSPAEMAQITRSDQWAGEREISLVSVRSMLLLEIRV
jgi:hypothetical protein